jgi:hypothetical protein
MGKQIVDLEPETPFHTFTIDQVEKHYNTSTVEGLSSAEATARLKEYGANELQGDGGVKWYKVLWRQVANALVVILLIATVSPYSLLSPPSLRKKNVNMSYESDLNLTKYSTTILDEIGTGFCYRRLC